ncbi:Sperm flagellar protein 1 [Paramecium bursaria]
MDLSIPLTEMELQQIYKWLDGLNLSRPKKNISRDFADGAMMAEIIHFYIPKLVELHNYPQAHSIQQKQYNWSTLNLKVFKKLGFQLTKNDIDQVIGSSPEYVERVLKLVQYKIERYLADQKELERKAIEMQKQQQQQQVQKTVPQSADIRQQLQEKDQAIGELKETSSWCRQRIIKFKV